MVLLRKSIPQNHNLKTAAELGVMAHGAKEQGIKRYLKICFLWILVPTVLGFLFAMAAAGPGGASAIFLFSAFFFGLIGALIHCVFASFRTGSPKEKTISVLALVSVLSYILWLQFSPPACYYTEENAYSKISRYVLKNNRNLDNLGPAKFNRRDCSYSFTYEGPEGKYEHVFSSWGEVHTWDYSQGAL